MLRDQHRPGKILRKLRDEICEPNFCIVIIDIFDALFYGFNPALAIGFFCRELSQSGY